MSENNTPADVVDVGVAAFMECAKAGLPDQIAAMMIRDGLVEDGDTVSPATYVQMAQVATEAIRQLAVLKIALEENGLTVTVPHE